MGRQIAAHLAREDLRPNHRFELDSYHAILSMVSAGQGWTILTPLGVLRAKRFVGDVDIVPLPLAPFTRRIMLTARRDVPMDVADRLRARLTALIVDPTRERLPWLADLMRVL
jgi:DNA-binding transcriptional LysR family regulator